MIHYVYTVGTITNKAALQTTLTLVFFACIHTYGSLTVTLIELFDRILNETYRQSDDIMMKLLMRRCGSDLINPGPSVRAFSCFGHKKY